MTIYFLSFYTLKIPLENSRRSNPRPTTKKCGGSIVKCKGGRAVRHRT